MALRQGILRLACVALALAFSAPASAQEERRVKDRGFALELHLGTRMPITVGQADLQFAELDGGFFAGAKIGRVMVGGSVDLQRVAAGQDAVGGHGSSSATLMKFMPGVRVAILRSADERVELYGQFDFGIGHIFINQSPSPGTIYEDSNVLISYQIGPGLRVWLHPQLALGMLFGLRGEFLSYDTSDNASASIGLTGLFAQLVFTGLF